MEDKAIYTIEAAQAALEADKQARITRTAQRIRAILDEEHTDLVARPQLSEDGRIGAVVQVVAR